MRGRIVSLCLIAALLTSPISAIERRWKAGEGAMGAWTDGSLWTPEGVPQPGDDLFVDEAGNYSCNTDASFQPRSVLIGSKAIGGGNDNGIKTVQIDAGTVLAPQLSMKFNRNANIVLNGTIGGSGDTTVNQGATLTVNSGAALTGPAPFLTGGGSLTTMNNAQITQRPVTNGGQFNLSGIATMSQGASFTNKGTMSLTGGLTSGDSSTMAFVNEGTLTVQGSTVPVGVPVTNSGAVTLSSGTLDVTSSSYKQTGGTTTITPTASLAGPVDLTGGVLATSGTVTGNVSNGGTVSLATPVSFATSQINGNYTQLPTGVIEFKIGGNNLFDRLLVSGVVTLAGQISLTFLNDYVPTIGETFPIMTFGSVSGTFAFFNGFDLGNGLEMVPVYSTSGLSLVAQLKQNCPEGSLCSLDNRFQLSLAVRDHRTDKTGDGVPLQQNDLFGFFSLPDFTGDPNNPEVFVKMLDGRTENGNFWVFYGGLTDLEYTLTVRDTVDSSVKSYFKDGGTANGGFDVGGGVTPETCVGEVDGTPAGSEAPGACTTGSDRLCLSGSRFRVELSARDPRTGNTGEGLSIPQSDLFGYFAIPELTDNPNNPEVFVKVVDGRIINSHYWVFFSGLTDFEYTLTVTDTLSGQKKSYTKDGGSACGAFDTDAF